MPPDSRSRLRNWLASRLGGDGATARGAGRSIDRRAFVAWVGAGSVAAAVTAVVGTRGQQRDARTGPVAVADARGQVWVTGAGRRFGDGEGRLYDVHPTLARVDFLAADGRLDRSVALSNPTSLAVDARGAVLVLTLDGTLAAFDRDGAPRGERHPAGLVAPHDLAVGARGIAIANTLGHDVVVLDPAGAERQRIGRGELDGPSSVAWRDDHLYVADIGQRRVAVFDARGALVDSFGDGDGPLRAPRAIRLDARGHAFVVDRVAGGVFEFDRAHRLVGRVTPSGAAAEAHWVANGADGAIVVSCATPS
ncbi:MAG: hypothetical protein U1F43_18960 [Myxococcota bacterium]